MARADIEFISTIKQIKSSVFAETVPALRRRPATRAERFALRCRLYAIRALSAGRRGQHRF